MLEAKWLKEKHAMIMLVIVGFIVFANTLGNNFNLDDNYYSAGNPITAEGVAAIPKIIKEATFYNGANKGFDYRPVTAISFAVQKDLIGDEAGISHFINLLLYLLTGLLIFRILLKCANTENRVLLSFLISLLFLVHPLHTEIVASIKSRDELLSLLFCLGSLLFVFKYFETQQVYFIAIAPVLFALALFSKYTVLPYIFIIPLALYFFKGLSIRQVTAVFVLIFVTAILCHLWKASVLPSLERDFTISENALVSSEYDFSDRVFTSLNVMWRYLLLHIFPLKLVFYYGANYIPVVSYTNIGAWLSLILHVAAAGYVLMYFKRKDLLVFGLIVYLAFIVVFSNLIELSPGLMAERFTYSSSLGFCIVLVFLLANFYEKINKTLKLNPLYIFFIFFLAYSVRSYARNRDWKDKETLYSNDVNTATNSAMVNFLYADWLLAGVVQEKQLQGGNLAPWKNAELEGRLRKAELYFKKTLQINPHDSLATANLSSVYIQLGDFANAEQLLKENLKRYKADPNLLLSLALSQKYQEKNKEAIESFRKILKNNPHHIIAIEQMNRAQLSLKDTAGALITLHKGTEDNPTSPVPLAELANYYLQVKDTVNAVAYAERAAALPPPNNGIFSFLAQYYQKRGNLQKSTYYQSLIR